MQLTGMYVRFIINTNVHSIEVVMLTKQFTGQDLFIICMGFIALFFIYTVLIVTGREERMLFEEEKQIEHVYIDKEDDKYAFLLEEYRK